MNEVETNLYILHNTFVDTHNFSRSVDAVQNPVAVRTAWSTYRKPWGRGGKGERVGEGWSSRETDYS